LSQDQIESREDENETVEKTEEVHGEKLPDEPEQVPDIGKQPDVEVELSLEETSSVTVESKPVAEEMEVHEEADEKAVQPVEPKVVQEEVVEKLEAADHPEHIEPEVDMTGSVSISSIVSLSAANYHPIFKFYSVC
jgi:hypothetical protein